MLRVGRLGEEVVGAHAHGIDGVGDAAVPGGDDDGDAEFALEDFFDELHAGQLGHAQIGDEDAVSALLQCFERLSTVLDGIDLKAQRHLQQFGQ